MSGLRDRVESRRRQAAAVAGEAQRLRGLPRTVAVFYLRAWFTALRSQDRFTLDSASRPSDVAVLLALADGYNTTVELGTGTAWTTIALALADSTRRVASYDPVIRPQRERYLALIPEQARARIALHHEPAEAARPEPASVGFLFIDCAHDSKTTAGAFRAWETAIAPGRVSRLRPPDLPRRARGD